MSKKSIIAFNILCTYCFLICMLTCFCTQALDHHNKSILASLASIDELCEKQVTEFQAWASEQKKQGPRAHDDTQCIDALVPDDLTKTPEAPPETLHDTPQVQITAAAFSPCGNFLAIGTSDDGVRVLGATTNEFIATMAGSIRALRWNPDISRTELLVARFPDTPSLVAWNPLDKSTRVLLSNQECIDSVDVSCQGTFYASSAANKITIGGLSDGKELLRTGRSTDDKHRAVSFSRGDGTLLAKSKGRDIVIVDIQDRKKCTYLPEGHIDQVTALSWRSDGKMIASAADDKTIVLWRRESKTGPFHKRTSLTGHTDKINIVSFSPDGKLLASCSDDRTTRLWDIPKRKPLRLIATHSQEALMRVIAWSPDSGTLFLSEGTIVKL